MRTKGDVLVNASIASFAFTWAAGIEQTRPVGDRA